MRGPVDPTPFGPHLLIGDEAALPSLAWRLETLPRHTTAIVVAEVATPDDRPALTGPDNLSVHWVYRDTRWATRALNDVLKGLFLPQNRLQAWISCGREQCRLIRDQLIDDHGVQPRHIFVSAF
ncbi:MULTISPECIES: siderophore-interacting protein [Asticcacaulis]|uniref:siderophore-interacting protein n=1 Tax=Asticcacaulis TaxID=76890 RepID=UPI001AE63297|nr:MULTISPECIES: siderophore-interacting protein [Asticcacaulis]MBP2158870.1 NADPH-dependent ferric siderophore reductase [Asticcacaulis solisilvae]MDR6799915.1 NADPH-dependent ferric siderophore reductase [Asticcacaulis sp. BE141]